MTWKIGGIASLVLLLCALILFTIAALAFKRKKNRYGLFSTESPVETIVLTILVGGFLSVVSLEVFPLVVRAMEVRGMDKTSTWTLLTTIFAAPTATLFVYWRHLGNVHDRISDVGKMLADEKPLLRMSALLTLERIARESSSMFHTVFELMCMYCRVLNASLADRSGDVASSTEMKYCVDMISRLWSYNCSRFDRLWNFRTSMSPDLRDVKFAGMELKGVDFNRFFLLRADFSKSNLCGIHLHRAFLHYACFFHTDLSYSFLCRAQLNHADMTGASLYGARLYGADLSECVNLRQEQIDHAHGNSATKIPPGLIRPATWNQPTRWMRFCCFCACRLQWLRRVVPRIPERQRCEHESACSSRCCRRDGCNFTRP